MKRRAMIVGLAMASVLPVAQAADACKAFKWDLSAEVALFQRDAASIAAGTSADNAAAISTGRLYEASLSPQSAVKLAVVPSKRMLDDGAHAGLFGFRVEEAGAYRIALDSGFWLELVVDGKALPAVDFNGSPQCAGPRKVVVYDLPAGRDLLLQFSAVETATARFTVTRVPPTP